jgi:hypothetical protein
MLVTEKKYNMHYVGFLVLGPTFMLDRIYKVIYK